MKKILLPLTSLIVLAVAFFLFRPQANTTTQEVSSAVGQAPDPIQEEQAPPVSSAPSNIQVAPMQADPRVNTEGPPAITPPTENMAMQQKAVKTLIKGYKESKDIEQIVLFLKSDADPLTLDLAMEALVELDASQAIPAIANIAGYPEIQSEAHVLQILRKRDLTYGEREELDLSLIVRAQIIKSLLALGQKAEPASRAIAKAALEKLAADCKSQAREQERCQADLERALKLLEV